MASLFSSPKTPEPTPIAPPPPPTPMVDENLVAKKKRANLEAQRGRGGRQSTLLSSSDTLGA